MATRERCPECGSSNITGRNLDMAGGDEAQDRYCFACKHSESRMRSEGGVNWFTEVATLHRGFAATGTERTLRDEIYAAPDDDALRSIYADWLIEQGDPLGTLIALQLGRAQRRDPNISAQEQAIVDEHWRGWLGDAALAAGPPNVEIERGFWSAADLYTRTIHPRFADELAWGTVRRLAIGERAARLLPRLLLGPLRRSLRDIKLGHRVMCDAVLDDPPEGLERVAIGFDVSRDPLSLRELARIARGFGAHCLAEYATRWLERTDDAGFADVTLTLDTAHPDYMRQLLDRARRMRARRLAIEVPGIFVFHLEREAKGVSMTRIEMRRVDIEPRAMLARAKQWMQTLAIDPSVKLAMRSITPELARDADAMGMKLVQYATSFGATPSR